MAVFRVEKNKNYTNMSNFHFYDKTLSWKAKGILSNMLSLPEDWDYSLAGLSTLTSDGMSSTRGAIKELEEHGYLKRRPIRQGGKFLDWEYIIFESPNLDCPLDEKPFAENPQVEKPQVEKPLAENSTQYNTKQLNTKQLNTKGYKKESTSSIKFDTTRDTNIDTTGSTNIDSTNKKTNIKNVVSKNKEYKKESKQKSFDEIIHNYTEDETTLDLLKEWLKVRKAKRAAMTDRAIQLNISKLDNLAKASDMTVDEYLEEVIARGWAAFYEIKSYAPKKEQSKKSDYCINENDISLDDLF